MQARMAPGAHQRCELMQQVAVSSQGASPQLLLAADAGGVELNEAVATISASLHTYQVCSRWVDIYTVP